MRLKRPSEFYADGRDKDEERDKLKSRRRGSFYFADGFLEKFETDFDNDESDDQGGDIFDAAVAEQVLLVGLTRGWPFSRR